MIVVAVILYATLWPDPAGVDSLPAIPHIDKLIHAVMFGGLAGATAFDRRRAGFALTRRSMMMCCLGAALFGVATEIAQVAMGIGRSGDGYDLAADFAGIIVAYFTAPPAIAAVLPKSRR